MLHVSEACDFRFSLVNYLFSSHCLEMFSSSLSLTLACGWSFTSSLLMKAQPLKTLCFLQEDQLQLLILHSLLPQISWNDSKPQSSMLQPGLVVLPFCFKFAIFGFFILILLRHLFTYLLWILYCLVLLFFFFNIFIGV